MKSFRFFFRGSLLLACLSSGLVLLALLAGHKLPYMGDLAYITDESGFNKLYLMDVQRQIRFLIKRPFINDCCLTWSPDGQTLTFVVDMSENSTDIFSTNFHTPLQRLTRSPGADIYPTYSPDGQHIAYTGYGYGNPEIYLMNADGSDQHILTGQKLITSLNLRPVWTVDGQSILFSDFANLDSLLSVSRNCVAACEDSIAKTFNTNGLPLMITTFMPLDQTRLLMAAFERTSRAGYGMYVMDTQSSQPPQRIAINANLASLSIAAYDHWIAFVSGSTDQQQPVHEASLFILDADCIGTKTGCDGKIQKVTNAIHAEDNLSWSPDGRWLAFVTSKQNVSQLNLLDTTCIWEQQDCADYIRPLPITSKRNIQPVWRPPIQ